MPQEIVFTGKGRMALADYQDTPLRPGEVRGPTVCSLISQGTELAWAHGEDFPLRPGYAAVFRVEEVGEGVTGVRPGELRLSMGHHRGSQQYPAAFTQPVPEGLSPEVAVLARLMGVSMTTLMTTDARPGDRVVITGAGPVGLLAAQNFLIGGYEVTVVDPDETRRAQAARMGVRDVRAAVPLDDPEMKGKVALVVECSGHEGAVRDGCAVVRYMGEVVLVGVPWGRKTEIFAHDILRSVFFGFVRLRSGWEWQVPVLSRQFLWEELLEGYNNAPHSTFTGFERALRWLADGRVSVDGLLRRVRPEDPGAIYEAIAARTIEEPFIVLDWEAGRGA